MNNYDSPGNIVNLVAPGGGVLTGVGYVHGQLFVVAQSSEDAGDTYAGQLEGVVSLPMDAALAVTEGDKVDWDNTAKDLVGTTLGDLHAGIALETKGAAAGQTLLVKLTRP